MPKPLAVLNIEDSESDSNLIARLLKKAGYKITFERVETASQMRAALKKRAWDVIISDHSLPQFDSYAAIRLLREEGLDIPFITVSGAVGEETAAAIMKAGAHDYLMKDDLTRLAPVIERELEQVEIRQERRRFEQELRDSEERFRELADNIEAVFWITESVSKKGQYVSPGYEKIWGRFLKDVDDFVKSVQTEDRSVVMAALEKQKRGEKTEIEYRIKHTDGSVHWVWDRAFPIFDASGKVKNVAGIATDVTERKRAEDTLRESEQKYRSLYTIAERREQERALLDSVRTTLAHEPDLTTILRTVVEAIAKTFGYTLVSLYLLRDETLVLQHQVGYSQVINEIPVTHGVAGRVVRSGLPLLIEDARADQAFSVSIDNIVSEVCVPLFYEDQIIGILNVESTQNTKLSEADLNLMIALSEHISPAIGRARLYKEIGKNEKRFRALIENSADAITLLDAQGFVTYDSPAAPGMLGYAPEERIGKSIFELIHADDLHKTRELLQKLIETKNIHAHSIFRIRHKNNSWLWIEAVATNLLDEPGVEAIVVNYRDITQRKQAEDALSANEARYRSLFEDSPIALWEENFSAVKHYLGALREQGITNFQAYFNQHPQAAIECAALIKVIDVNHATMELFGANKKDDLMENFVELLKDEPREQFQNELVNIAEGKTSFGWEGIIKTLDGATRNIELSWQAVPDHENSLSRVIVSMINITERKKMEAALLRSELAHRTLFENVPVGLYRTTADGRILDANPALVNMFGYQDRTSLMRMNATDLYADPATDKAFENEIKKSDSVTNFETRFRRRDGTILYAEDNIHVIRDENGNPLFYEGSLIDVTERRRSEEALRESEERFRSLFNRMMDGVYRSEHEGKFVNVNLAMVKMFGYSSREEMLAVDIKNELYFEPEERGSHILDTGQEEMDVYRMRRKDGSEIWVEDHGSYVHDEQGKIIYHEGILRDITERRRAEEAVRESEARFRTLFVQAPLGMALVDSLTGEICEVNPRFAEISGRSMKGMENINWNQITHPDDLQADLDNQDLLNAGKINGFQMEKRYLNPDGTVVWINMTIAPLKVEDKSHPRQLCMIEDITERKRASQVLAESEERFRQAITVADAIPYSLNYAPDHYTFMGEGIKKLTGYSPAEMTAPALLDPLILESNMLGNFKGMPLPEAVRLIREGKSGVLWQCEHRIRTRYGEERWLTDSSIQVLGDDGIPTGSIGIFQDITERKLAEQIVNESEARYRSLFEDSPVSLWEEDFSAVKLRMVALRDEGVRDFRAYFASHPREVLECISLVKIVDVNKATLKLFGAKVKADLIHNLTRFIDNDSAQLFQNELVSIAQGKSHFEWEGVNQTLDGRQIIIGLSLSVIPGYEDTFSKVIISMVDVTARIQAEKAIRESEKYLRESQMIAGLGSYTLDIPSEKWTSSDILNQIFGIDESRTRSVESWTALIHPDWRQEMSDYFTNEVLGNHIRFDREYKIVRNNDGAERWVNGLGELEFDAHNQPVKMRGTIQDITERKQAEIDVRERADEMELINSLNEAVNRGESLASITQLFAKKLSQISRCNEATFYMLSPDGNNIVMQNLDRSQSSVKKIEQLIGRPIPPIQIPVKEGNYFHRALHSEHGILTTDPEAIQSWIAEFTETNYLPNAVRGTIRRLVPQIYKLLNIRSAIAIPLVSDKKVIGLFDVSSSEMLTEKDLNRIQKISVQLTAVILRQQVEDKLRESEEKYRLLFESNPLTMWIYDLETLRFLKVNDAAVDHYGYSVGEFMSMTIKDIRPSEEIPKLLENIARVTSGIDEAGVWHHLKKDGTLIQVEIISHTVEFAGRRAELVLVSDVTKRKQAEEALNKSEQRYRALFEEMPIAIWEQDFSEVKRQLDALKGEGITDFRAYFASHPDAVVECANKIRIMDVNNTAVKMFKAENKEQLIAHTDQGLSEGEREHINEFLVDIADGMTSNGWEGFDQTMAGEPIEISLNWSVAPGHETDFSNVIVTTVDITARKQAEDALRTNEEKYRLIIENAGEALYVVQNGLIVFANPMFEKMAELSASELIGKSILEFVLSQEDRMEAIKSHRRLLRGKIANTHKEFKVRLRSGKERWVNVNEVRTTWNGELAALTFATDITERKQSEDALQKSEERFRALIANAGDLIIVIDQQGVVQFASPSSERILGYRPEETVGSNLTEWVHPDDLSEVLESLDSRYKASGVAPESIKARGRHKNGSWRILDTIGTSLINEPAIQGIVLNIRDITERELTDEALRTSEAQFRAIFEGAAIGIALVDATGHPVKNNFALQEMLGYDTQELRNMVFTDFTHPDDVMTDWNLWQELIAGKRDHYQIEKRFIHKSGRIIWVKLTSSVVPDTDNKILFGVGMVEDITDRKNHEREQEALASVAHAINQSLDLDVLLQNLLDAALHAIPLAEKGAILLLDAEDNLRIRALNGYLDPRVRAASFPSTSGYSARAVREGQPLIIADARADLPTRYDQEIEEIGAIQSAVVAPLMVKGHAIGAISLDNASRKGAFGPVELNTLSTIASSAALVIQNTRLFEETRQRVAELELLYESGLAISQLLNPKEIGQKIIDLLEQKMNWHHTAIRLYNAKDETLELLAFHQPNLKSVEERLAVEARFKTMVSRSSQGVSGWVIQHGETVRTGDLINDDRYVETFVGLHSGLYVPIKAGERIIGVISIESEKENAFSKSDEQLTTILATQAASIFENARLYEDTIHRAVELEQRVTERTAQIEATKRRLELATHAGQIGVWEYNPRENKVLWDERMHMIHKIPVGGFDGTSEAWAKLIHPNDIETSQINKQLAVTKNLLLNDEHRILWPDGSVRHIMTSAVIAYSLEGVPDRIIGINMDITERKQIEQSLRESETYARLLFDAVPDPVSVTEADGLIVDVNNVFEKQYGLMRDEIRGRHISELGIYSETDLDKRDEYLSEILQGQPADPVVLEFNVPGEGVHTLELHSYLIRVNGKRLMLNTSHDITAYKKAEETQRLAKSEMEHALRIKNEFLANMSHELRTPLNSILGISESLEEQIVGALNEKQLKYVGVVRESGRHLLELINDILDLSKIEAGRMELDIRHISVEKFCQSSLRMIKELAQRKSLNVSYKMSGDVKIILGDERRLKQSLVNLLSNAVKFSPVGSRIGLEVDNHSETNEVTFTVWDHGVGIAQEDIQHLFKPFVQLDAGLTREYQGTGLGLALVAQMVHLHGGHVRVESKVGKGSRFIITLPWSQEEQKPQAKVTAKLLFPSPRSDVKRSGRILLVEDTDVVVQLISEFLRYKGYEIILAHNGVEGMKLAAQERPDLILMDVMMPIMDGLEATQNIRKDISLQHIPIIALTALAMSGDSERCLAAGMNDYLSKPIQMQVLADMIEKYLKPGWEESNEQ